MYHGDIRLGDTIDIKFSTFSLIGTPTALVGGPTVAAYPDNSLTEITAGITLTTVFDGRTALNNVRVVATGANGYLAATNYTLVITAGMVGGISAVGRVVGSFSIEKRSALMPATAGQTIDVDAAGLVNITQAAADKVWASATRTLTSFGTLVADVANAVWDELTAEARAAGSYGQLMKDNINFSLAAIAAFIDTEVAAIKAKTDQLTFTVAGKVDATIQAAGDFAQAAADKVWASATRTLTSFGTLVSDIWANATRTLTGAVTLASPQGVQKNTALANFHFVMFDSTGAPAPGLTVTAQRVIDGGSYAAAANPASEVGSGTYRIDFAASDMNGDVVTFKFTAAGAKTTYVTIKTVQP